MDKESQYFLKSAGIDPFPLELVPEDDSIPTNCSSLKEFVEWYLEDGWVEYATMDPITEVITSRCKYRSLGDIFRVCYNYYPEATFVEVRRHVLKCNVVGQYCHDINRRVYVHKDAKPGWDQCDFGKHDEFGFRIYYYNTFYKKKVTSTAEYFELAQHRNIYGKV